MTKKILTLIGSLILSTSMFAQQGLFRQPVPGSFQGPQGVPLSGLQVSVCAAGTSSATTCAAAPISITSDQAGASPITQPCTSCVSNGFIQFYAPPGTYTLMLNYPGLADSGNNLSPINVNADPVGNVALKDGKYFVSAQEAGCLTGASVGANTGTTSAPDGTFALDGTQPNAMVAMIGKRTNASGSHIVFYCHLIPPAGRVTSGKDAVIQNIQIIYSVQTTTATSMPTAILTGFTAPVAGNAEAASSATFVSFGGTLAMLPLAASANLTAISAGQYYNQQVTLGTPGNLVNLQDVQIIFEVDQSASSAELVSVPGYYVNYSIPTI